MNFHRNTQIHTWNCSFESTRRHVTDTDGHETETKCIRMNYFNADRSFAFGSVDAFSVKQIKNHINHCFRFDAVDFSDTWQPGHVATYQYMHRHTTDSASPLHGYHLNELLCVWCLHANPIKFCNVSTFECMLISIHTENLLLNGREWIQRYLRPK